ncbi:hypothetical protein MOQ_001076 [Trypanosoma cruzi marinkellei]|uniref:Uncharacterized protein n=1 Tax=Trypanosoma cruzi marinkellei TaxID=85056 RepID=K2NLS4_TRYCR|nr:hypothetical protein MOQ_001076 [Trypanosoma cruzi marinkellei]
MQPRSEYEVSFCNRRFSIYSRPVRNIRKSIAASIFEYHTHSPQAWRCLSVGCFGEAQRLSRAKNDIVCLAASLAMCGNTSKALTVLEAYIIATCVLAHEKRLRPYGSEERHVRRLNELIVGWMTGPNLAEQVMGQSAQARNEEEYYAAVLDASAAVDWDTIHRWFIIALFLHEGKGYKPPNVLWFHYFFGLFRNGTPVVEEEDQRSTKPRQRQQIAMDELSNTDVEDILLSQCERNDIHFISAVTAWKTRRYRSAIAAATEFLSVEGSGYKITDSNMRVMTRFIRCMSLIEIGERTIATNDAFELLKNDDHFVSIVGASISAFLMPLPSAVKLVTSYDGEAQMQNHAFVLCEYVHALTLAQLGCMEAAREVLRCAMPFASKYDVGEWMTDLMLVVCTALEDSSTILKIPLSPHRQLYISMCPVFFGGFGSGCARLRSNTPAARLLYPRRVPTYVSVRQMLPFHLNRAHHFFVERKYIEAWSNICLAVGCAEEVVGSLEMAFTDCSPMKTYYFGCRLGLEVLQTVLGVMSLGENAIPMNYDRDSAYLLLEEGNALCEEVIRKCAEWSQRLRQFYPNVRLGCVALSQYFTMSRTHPFISRAICLAGRYPRCVLAQNCLTFALYTNHHIPEAVDNATKALQTFPHSSEIVSVYRHIVEKDGVYVFNYRTLVPVRYAPGSGGLWTKRMFILLLLLVLNFLFFALTLIVNIPGGLIYSESMKEISVRLQLPSVFPLLYALLIIVYAVLATVSERNLVQTIMVDLFFRDTWINRLLYSMRGIALVNAVNAIQITVFGNNFLFESHWYTFLLYIFFTLVLVPFTSRVWFLPSIDEPKDSVWTWLTLLAVDTLSAPFLLVPHITLFALEPLMFIAFFFFQPALRPDRCNMGGNIQRRLRIHNSCLRKCISPYVEGKQSQFIHVRLMSLLYYNTHSDLNTKNLMNQQIDEDDYRIFPLIDVYDNISTKPIERLTQEEIIKQESRHGVMDFLASVHESINIGMDEEEEEDGVDSSKYFPGAMGSNYVPDIPEYLINSPDAKNEASNAFAGENVVEGDTGAREERRGTKGIFGLDSAKPSGKKRARVAGLIDLILVDGEEEKTDGETNRRSREFNRTKIQREVKLPEEKHLTADVPSTTTSDEVMFSSPVNCMTGRVPARMSLRADARECLTLLADTYRASMQDFQNSVGFSCRSMDENVALGSEPSNYPGTKGAPERLRNRLSAFSSAARSRIISAADGNETPAFHTNPDFVPFEEISLLCALQALFRALNMPLSERDSHSDWACQLQEKKKLVEERLLERYELNSRQLTLKSHRCLELCCKIAPMIVEAGDDELNPSTAGNLTLIGAILLLNDASEIFDTLLLNGLLEHCVVHGYTGMLSLIMSPRCGERMKYPHWESLLRSFGCDSSPQQVESLHIVLSAFQQLSEPSLIDEIVPLFQRAVEAALSTQIFKASPTAVENLLSRIKRDGNLKVDFWQVEGTGGQTIFSNACAVGNLGLVESLWSLGLVPNPNRVQSDGTNALMQAVMHNREDVVRWFCELPADMTAESFKHQHPKKGTVLDITQRGTLHSMLKDAMTKQEREGACCPEGNE